MSNISERLLSLLEENNISASKLAKQIGMTPPTLLKWLHGDVDPKLKHLLLIADNFDCSLEYLVGRSDDYSKSGFKPAPPFAEQLKRVIEESGKSIYSACKHTTFAYRCFWDWFHGQEPLLSSLIQLADFYGLTLDQLVGRE